MRTVHLPPYKSFSGWDISIYRDRWDFIEEVLNANESNAVQMSVLTFDTTVHTAVISVR